MTVTLRQRTDFTLDMFHRVAWGREAVSLHSVSVTRMQQSRKAFLQLLDAEPDSTVYGVTTGYGQHASITLSRDERRAQAARPPYAVVTGFGEPLPDRVARGIVFARLTNFIEGHAAISPGLAQAVAALLDASSLPSIPRLGSQAAGEIIALGHLFAELASTHPLAEKDTLALVNGSPCATALIADAALAASRRWRLAAEVFALAAEAIQAPLDAYHPALAELWQDDHEAAALDTLRGWLEGGGAARRPYQAPVSWRIVPRALGQAHRALAQAEQIARTGLQAVTDNPVYLAPDPQYPHGRVLSNGGYHNGAAYPALDQLAASWADLALLCDRQVNKLLDGKVSLLPDYLMEDEGYIGCLGFTVADCAQQARVCAARTFLPGSEGGGFGQNDVAVPTFSAWHKESQSGRYFDACLAILAVVASQALHVTRRKAPPNLESLLDTVRGSVAPVTKPRVLGTEVGELAEQFTARVFESAQG